MTAGLVASLTFRTQPYSRLASQTADDGCCDKPLHLRVVRCFPGCKLLAADGTQLKKLRPGESPGGAHWSTSGNVSSEFDLFHNTMT